MAALNSSLYTKQAAGRSPVPSGPLAAGAGIHQQATVAIPATGAGTALNDTVGLFYVPKGAILVGFTLDSDDLDTGGPTITWDVGDSGSATRILSASTVSQAGGAARALITALGYQFTADTAIFATVHAAATTKAAGNISASISYVMGGLAS